MSNGADITLLNASYVVPVRPRGRVLENHTVVVINGVIESVLPTREARSRWTDAAEVVLTGQALIPGLVNAHTHSPMTLLRGYADDMELDVWLHEHIWPAEGRFVRPDFVTDGTRLAVAEMFRSGTTCFNDMYFFQDETIDVCRSSGMRVSAGITVIEMASSWAADVDEYLDKGLGLLETYRDDPLVSFALAPHSPYTISDPTMDRIAEASVQHGLPVHMHVLETAWEIQKSQEQHGVYPLERLDRHGLLNERLIAVHMTQLGSSDIEKVANSDARVVHCPQSNLKLASGFCPVNDLMDAGVTVALGTDGAAANNDLDMLGELQTAALLAKGVAGKADALGAADALEMATLSGARALGLEDSIGSIEPGKQADLCAIDLMQPETQPLHNVVSQLVYAASARQVTDVWVAGRRVLDGGALVTVDQDEIIETAERWRGRLARFAAGSTREH